MAASWLPWAASLAMAGADAPDCPPDPQLSYVCGPEKPEDVLAIPGTPWLIASGFAPGAGLKLIDTRDRSVRRWGFGGGAADEVGGCPGAPAPALLNIRGLSLRQTGARRWRLLAVNHGGREAVELFDVTQDGAGAPQLRWHGCRPMPPGQVGNAVASFRDGTILVTVLTRPGTAIADFVRGAMTGMVWEWRPGARGFAPVPGTELPGNNGIEVDPDDRHFYVVAFGWHAVVVFDRRATRDPVARIIAPGFMPDNLHWSGGRLLLAGMALDEPACGGLRRIVGGVADPMLCHRGWTVGEVNLRRRRIVPLISGPPQPGFNGLSAAALVDRTLWLGSFQSSRLATVNWTPDASKGARK